MDTVGTDNERAERDPESERSEPGIGIARRASVLVAVARPRPSPDVEQPSSPVAKVALMGIGSGFAGGPQMALEAAADQGLGGRPTSPEQVRRYRGALLAGNAGLMAAGVVAQRILNHSRHRGTATELGSALARQLTVGAAAASIIIVSDTVLGPLAQRKADSGPATTAVNIATLRGQSMVLRKVAGALTLPTQPDPYSYVG